MKLSYNWLKEYINIDYSPEKTAEILTDIGLEVEGIEEHESIKGGLKGFVIGKVLTCEKHPDADKLNLTTIDIGAENPVQIVCGAPNIAQGQTVPVATVGTIIHLENDSFPIKKSKIRGVESHGMVCSEVELGIGKESDGIKVYDSGTPGTPLSKVYDVENDYIFEIGLTPNRSDAFSYIGTAKDLLAALKINFDYNEALNLPEIRTNLYLTSEILPISLEVKNETACRRYCGVVLNNITIQDSPKWMQEKLKANGINPINNIVDITNFVMLETGQPLHAFDYNQIAEQKVIVQNLPQNTAFMSLDDVERKLNAEDLMICDGDSNGMCIAGIYGGATSGVSDKTTTIFLESAFFDPIVTRKSSQKHNLRTDAAIRFEKGIDINNSLNVLKRAADLIIELAEATVASEIIDFYPNKVEKAQIEVDLTHVNALVGVEMTKIEVENILSALDIEILKSSGKNLTVSVNTDKPDVTREADIIEEIIRIYGLNKVPVSNQLTASLSFTKGIDKDALVNRAAEYLVGKSFYEAMNNSITKSAYFRDILPVEPSKLVTIQKSINTELDAMRPTMLFGLLENIKHNSARKNTDLQFFEFGKIYSRTEEAFVEEERLALVLTGNSVKESWLNEKTESFTFFDLKRTVEQLLAKLKIGKTQVSTLSDEEIIDGVKFHRGKFNIARLGFVQPSIAKKMGVNVPVLYAELDWKYILENYFKQSFSYKTYSNFPSVKRDLALVIDKSVTYDKVEGVAKKVFKDLLIDFNLFSVYEDDSKLGKDKKSYAISMILQDKNKTLAEKEIESLMSKLIKEYEKKTNAIIRT